MPDWVGWSELASKLSVRCPLAANNAEKIKIHFLAKTQRREEKHKHDNLFSASSRLCENYF
jgi:uncharacterized protein (DUF2132 family)